MYFKLRYHKNSNDIIIEDVTFGDDLFTAKRWYIKRQDGHVDMYNGGTWFWTSLSHFELIHELPQWLKPKTIKDCVGKTIKKITHNCNVLTIEFTEGGMLDLEVEAVGPNNLYGISAVVSLK